MPYRTIEDSAKRIAVRLVKRGRDTRHEIADICDMSTRTIDRAVAQDRDEGFVGKHPGRKRGPKDILIAKDVELALRFVDHNPTRFLSELKDILERYRYISASEATIHRMLKKRRISLKKVQKMASEQTAEAEADFVVRIAEYPAHYLVCVDEMSKDDRTYARTRGRSRRGQRCKVYQPFVRKRRFTVIGGMALDAGIIASRVIEGSSDRDTFLDFLEEDLLPTMNPYPGPRSVVLLDNARIHHSEEVYELVEAFGCRLEFLPPYSPHYNPIEQAWSAIKAYLHRIGISHFSNAEAYYELYHAMDVITPEMTWGCYRHSGYL